VLDHRVDEIVDVEEQISQQQGIYDQISDLTVGILWLVSARHSDGRLFSQVVFWCSLETSRGNARPMSSPLYRLTFKQRSPSAETKLDSILTRLCRVCSEEGNCDTLRVDNESERRVKLFKYVAVIDSNPQ